MIRLVRITGFLMIAAGGLVFLTYFIDPLRELWPVLLELPLPIRIGAVLAGFGLLVLLGSLIWERIEDREHDKSLLDD